MRRILQVENPDGRNRTTAVLSRAFSHLSLSIVLLCPTGLEGWYTPQMRGQVSRIIQENGRGHSSDDGQNVFIEELETADKRLSLSSLDIMKYFLPAT